jgi:hypothetical protein
VISRACETEPFEFNFNLVNGEDNKVLNSLEASISVHVCEFDFEMQALGQSPPITSNR